MRLLISVHLISEGSEQTVAISADIANFSFEDRNLFIKFLGVFDVFFGKFKLVAFAHFLSELFLDFHVFFTVLSSLLNFLSLIFLMTHEILLLMSKIIIQKFCKT